MWMTWKGDPPAFNPAMHVTRHFKFHEFCRSEDPWPPQLYDRLLRLAGVLEAVRIDLGCPLLVTSGYRSPGHNAKTAGSAEHSQHCAGRAADFRMVPPGGSDDFANQLTREAHDYLLRHDDRLGLGGLGWYRHSPRQPRARVHVDLRWRPPGGALARWVKDA